jgi:hypothetical protein
MCIIGRVFARSVVMSDFKVTAIYELKARLALHRKHPGWIRDLCTALALVAHYGKVQSHPIDVFLDSITSLLPKFVDCSAFGCKFLQCSELYMGHTSIRRQCIRGTKMCNYSFYAPTLCIYAQ